MDSNLLDKFFDVDLEDLDLLEDDSLLFNVGDLSDLNSQFLDSFSDNVDLVDQLSDDGLVLDNSLSEDSDLLNEFLLNNGDWLLSVNSDLSNSLSNNLLNLDDLGLDDVNLLSDDGDLLDDSSSFGLWSTDELDNQMSELLFVDLNILDKLEDLGDFLDDNLLLGLDDGEVFWLVETVVVWLLVEGDLSGTARNTSSRIGEPFWVGQTGLSQLRQFNDSGSVVLAVVTSVNWGNLSNNLQSLDGSFDLVDLLNSLSDNSSDSEDLL